MLKTTGVTNCGNKCRGVEHADAGNRCQAAHRAVLPGECYEFCVQRLDLLVKHSPFVPQFDDQAADTRRQDLISFGKETVQSALELHAACGEYDTSLKKNGTQLIDQGRSLRNQPGSNPMQRLDIQLLLALQFDKPHRRS